MSRVNIDTHSYIYTLNIFREREGERQIEQMWQLCARKHSTSTHDNVHFEIETWVHTHRSQHLHNCTRYTRLFNLCEISYMEGKLKRKKIPIAHTISLSLSLSLTQQSNAHYLLNPLVYSSLSLFSSCSVNTCARRVVQTLATNPPHPTHPEITLQPPSLLRS